MISYFVIRVYAKPLIIIFVVLGEDEFNSMLSILLLYIEKDALSLNEHNWFIVHSISDILVQHFFLGGLSDKLLFYKMSVSKLHITH